MTPRSEDLHRELGSMANELKNIGEGMHAMRAAQAAADRRADEREEQAADGRRRLHERVEETHVKLNHVSAEVAGLKRDLEVVRNMAHDAKVIADKVSVWEQRGRGMLIALGLLGTVIGATLTSWFEAFTAFLRSKFGL